MDPTTPEESSVIIDTKIGFIPISVAHPFKDTRGRYRTKSLFKEWETPAYPAYYNLGPEDEGKYASLRKRYLEIADPTEYEFASKALGGWDHHTAMLRNCKWYREHIEEWRKELYTLLQSKALAHIKAIAETGRGAIKLNANRYIAEQGWKNDGKAPPKRGRPTKNEVEGELKKQAEAAAKLEDDANRIGVH